MEMIKRITFTILTALFVTIFIGINQAFAVNAEENYKWYCSQCHGLTAKAMG